MTRPGCLVKTVGGWSLYLIPCMGGYSFEWRCPRDRYGILCSGWELGSAEGVRRVAEQRRVQCLLVGAKLRQSLRKP